MMTGGTGCGETEGSSSGAVVAEVDTLEISDGARKSRRTRVLRRATACSMGTKAKISWNGTGSVWLYSDVFYVIRTDSAQTTTL